MERTILPPYTPETFPENTALPEGAKSVRWQDSFGYGVAFKPNIVYAQRDGKELHIHYLTPRDDRTDNPLIVFVQGSAWFQQDLFIHLPEMLRMCQKGYCVALVEYRPSTVAKFPAQAEDAKTAIRFLRSQAEKYRFDPERVALWGGFQRRAYGADGGHHRRRVAEPPGGREALRRGEVHRGLVRPHGGQRNGLRTQLRRTRQRGLPGGLAHRSPERA